MKTKKTYSVPEMKNKQEVDWRVETVLSDFDCAGLWDLFDDYLPIRLFRNARIALTGKDEYLEVKGMADVIAAIKSRGQIGYIPLPDNPYKGHMTLLAKFSVKPPLQELETDKEEYKYVCATDGARRQVEGQYLLDHFAATENGRDAIIRINQYNLPSASKIMKSNGRLDLMQQIAVRKLNCDFDFKRLPVLAKTTLYEGGRAYPPPYTRPFHTLKEMKVHRSQVENIRRSGRVARPEEVVTRVHHTLGKTTRAQGGGAAELVRLFVRGLLQGHFHVAVSDSYPLIADKLTEIW